MAPHSSTLAWKIPWMEEPGRLQSMRSLRVRHDWATSLSLFTFHALEKEMATHSNVLAWRIPGMGEPGGLLSMGSHRVGHDWSDLAAAAAAEKQKLQWGTCPWKEWQVEEAGRDMMSLQVRCLRLTPLRGELGGRAPLHSTGLRTFRLGQ